VSQDALHVAKRYLETDDLWATDEHLGDGVNGSAYVEERKTRVLQLYRGGRSEIQYWAPGRCHNSVFCHHGVRC
jgi:hypothetical protein